MVYRPDGIKRNFLSHTFFYVTFVFGVFFTFFYQTDSVGQSVLYKVTKANVGEFPLPIWGLCAILVAVLNTAGIVAGRVRLVRVAAMGGFLLWLFAGIAYLLAQGWFQFLVAAVPQIVFWIWYYFKVGDFQRTYNRI